MRLLNFWDASQMGLITYEENQFIDSMERKDIDHQSKEENT